MERRTYSSRTWRRWLSSLLWGPPPAVWRRAVAGAKPLKSWKVRVGLISPANHRLLRLLLSHWTAPPRLGSARVRWTNLFERQKKLRGILFLPRFFRFIFGIKSHQVLDVEGRKV